MLLFDPLIQNIVIIGIQVDLYYFKSKIPSTCIKGILKGALLRAIFSLPKLQSRFEYAIFNKFEQN